MSNDNNNSTTSSCQTLLRKLTARQNLTQKEATQLTRDLMSETLSETLKAAILTALAAKGETIDEITGMAREMRTHSIKVPSRNPLLDTCGTGGSGLTRLNVSTASAFILASCGVRVAKHGNRAASGRVGSFDVLEALGAKIELRAAQVAQTIQKTNLGFMFAPLFHPAMKHIMPVRKELGIRTVFNILGPLTNPAKAQYQILGVSSEKLGAHIITVLKNLRCKRAMVVYGEDGLDEITITAGTRVWELNPSQPPTPSNSPFVRWRTVRKVGNTSHTPPLVKGWNASCSPTLTKGGIKGGSIRSYRITPEQFGMKRALFSKIKGGNVAQNARVIRGVLDGSITDARLDIILLNAGAGFYVYGATKSIKEGITRARNAIISGQAKAKLAEYITVSNTI